MNSALRFAVFLTIVLTVYGGMNFYFIRALAAAFKTETASVRIIRGLVLTVLFLSPILSEVLKRKDYYTAAKLTGFAGYAWTALLFMFLVFHGTAVLVLFVARSAGMKTKPETPRLLFLVITAAIILSLCYGFFEARMLRVKRLALETKKLPAGMDKLDILFFSDTHFSRLFGEQSAEKLCRLMDELDPDVILSGGDLIDPGMENADAVARIFSRLDPPEGKFTVTGNHEFYAGIRESVEFIEKAGFTLLRNESAIVAGGINIAGADDITSRRFMKQPPQHDEREIFSGIDNDYYTILLKHQPDIDESSTSRFNLQLSGHTHGGQIFPFHIFVKLSHRYIRGLHLIDGDTRLYVTTGAGVWGPPFRLMARPEIVLITLKRQSDF